LITAFSEKCEERTALARSVRAHVFRIALELGHCLMQSACRKSADSCKKYRSLVFRLQVERIEFLCERRDIGLREFSSDTVAAIAGTAGSDDGALMFGVSPALVFAVIQRLILRPAAKLQIEYHKIEIINGVLRPMRSASYPEPTAPTKRSQRVTVNTAVTSMNVERFRDRYHDQQEDREVERASNQAKPRSTRSIDPWWPPSTRGFPKRN
jgi:hypothetical protein